MQGYGLILAGFQRGEAILLGEGCCVDFKGVVAAVYGEGRVAAVGLVNAGFLPGPPSVVEIAFLFLVVGVLLICRVLIRILVLLQVVLIVRETHNDVLDFRGLRILHAARVVITDAEA